MALSDGKMVKQLCYQNNALLSYVMDTSINGIHSTSISGHFFYAFIYDILYCEL